MAEFYDGIAPDCHVLYGEEWDAVIERQGAALINVNNSSSPAVRRGAGEELSFELDAL